MISSREGIGRLMEFVQQVGRAFKFDFLTYPGDGFG